MHNPTHPKAFALLGLSRIACEKLGLRTAAVEDVETDTLAHLSAHPVYPAIARAIGIDAEPYFRLMSKRGAPQAVMELDDFLTASFVLFANLPRSDLLAVDGVIGAAAALGYSI